MQKTLSLELVGCLSDKGFSLDELVVRVKDLFEQEGMAGVVALLLSLFDEELALRLTLGGGSWRPKPCCKEPKYALHSRDARRFRTSVGEVRIAWRRLRCVRCGKSVVPLREFLQLPKYQSKTAELEQAVAEVVSEQSYRRTSRHLALIGEIPVPKSTAHRWVMESDCDELKTDGKVVDVLFADGTGYKRRPDPTTKQNNRGEVRVALGVTSDGTVVSFGAWSGESWEEIGQAIRKNTVDVEPAAKLLVSDGEAALAEGLAHVANAQQRSHWHTVHYLDRTMWKDKATKSERRAMQTRLAGVLGIELPAEDFKHVPEEDKACIEQKTRQAEDKIDELIGELLGKGYGEAAAYVRNAKDRLFTYVRFWLATGLISPRASSMIERIMREIGRRLKRIAFGWSERGAAKMARIIIKRITTAGEWQAYWNDRLRIQDNVILFYRGIKVAS